MTRRSAEPLTPGPLKVTYRPLASLIPYAENARTHTPEQVALLARSIREFGWTNPILVGPEGGIIAGHARVMAAGEVGFDPVPCIELGHLSDKQRAALVIADNQLAIAGAGWDADILRSQLGILRDGGYDIGVIGFPASDLASLFNRGGGLTDPDDAPPLPPVPVTQPGDLWLLGRHRLYYGDSTAPDEVAVALGDRRPHLMVTDPPYGVSYDAHWRARAGLNAEVGPAHGVVLNDERADWSAAWALFPGTVAYVWHGGLHGVVVHASLASAGFLTRAQIVWIKTRPVISRGAYHWQHEPVLYAVRGEEDAWQRFEPEHEVAGYAVRKGATAHWEGGRKQSTVWFIEHLRSDTGHSAQKPVECMRRPIENNSKAGDAVFDPFLGSGTTCIAAEMTGRDCIGLEIDPGYCDVVAQRFAAFVGQQPVLAATGEPFDVVAEQRKAVNVEA